MELARPTQVPEAKQNNMHRSPLPRPSRVVTPVPHRPNRMVTSMPSTSFADANGKTKTAFSSTNGTIEVRPAAHGTTQTAPPPTNGHTQNGVAPQVVPPFIAPDPPSREDEAIDKLQTGVLTVPATKGFISRDKGNKPPVDAELITS